MAKQYRTADPVLIRALCADIAGIAQREYPWYAWGVRATADGSMIEMICDVPGLATTEGWMFSTERIQQVSGRTRMIRAACGEILERFGLSRERKTPLADVAAHLYRDTRGELHARH